MHPLEMVTMMIEMSSKHSKDFQSEIDKYRLRLFDAVDVPFLRELSQTGVHLLIDLAETSSNNDRNDSADLDGRVDETLNEESIEMAGSPLKVDFLHLSTLKANDVDFYHHRTMSLTPTFPVNPLSVSEARLIISTFATSPLLYPHWIWTLADANDPLRTVMFGIRRTTMNETIAANAQIKVTCAVTQSTIDGAEKRCKARSFFELMPLVENVDDDADEDGQNEFISSLLTLHTNWTTNDASPINTRPPVHSQLTVIPIRWVEYLQVIRPGWLDERTPFYEKAKELRSLMSFADALKTGAMSWIGDGKVGFESIDANDAAQQLIIDEDYQKPHHQQSSQIQRHHDFTERLWLIIKECSDNQQLIDCLSSVFSALKSGKLKPMVHQDNRSTLARLVRDACTADRLMLPRLEALYPIQIALEIGLEFFRRDYIHLFASSAYLANTAELQSMFDFDSSPEDQAHALRPIHSALEVLCMCEKYLKLPAHRLTTLSREILHTFYRQQNQENCKNLEFRLDMRLIDIDSSIVEMLSPITCTSDYTYSMRSAKIARFVDHLSSKCPLFEYASTYPTNVDDTTKNDDEVFYYRTQLVESVIAF